MRPICLLLLLPVSSGPAFAQTIASGAIFPVVTHRPYIAELVHRHSVVGADGTMGIDEQHSTLMRDSAGRLREESAGTPPDEHGSFRLAWVRVLDPVSMQQTDLNLSEHEFSRFSLVGHFPSSAPPLDACTGPAQYTGADGSTTHFRYEALGRATLQGVSASGCRSTANSSQAGQSWVTESWTSPDLHIILSSITRYDDGRSDEDRVLLLRREEPDAALFRIPPGFTDLFAPRKADTGNLNPNLSLLAEYGSVTWHNGSATLDAGGSDTVRQVALTLQACLHLPVSAERPFQNYLGDLLDVTAPAWAAQHPDLSGHVFAGKPAHVHFDFTTGEHGRANHPEELLRAVVQQINTQQPYDFRVATIGSPSSPSYILSPQATHDETGKLIFQPSYMDTPVSLPLQRSTIADLAAQMASQLTAATGYHFDCCHAAIFGTPWGMKEIQYEADRKPAREVLLDLMQAEGTGKAYTAACDARSHIFCFISLAGLPPAHRTPTVCTLGGS